MSFGDITLDKVTFALQSNGGHVRLASKEFQMLELLMCQPSVPITKERFIEKI